MQRNMKHGALLTVLSVSPRQPDTYRSEEALRRFLLPAKQQSPTASEMLYKSMPSAATCEIKPNFVRFPNFVNCKENKLAE